VSFDSLLETIEAGATPTSRELTQLNGIDQAAHARFARAWQGLPDERRREIVDQLAVLAEDNVELNFNRVFRLGLHDGDAGVRAESIRALWEDDGRDLVNDLRGLIGDDDPAVRSEAALALGRVLLRAELEDWDDPLVRIIEDDLRALHEDRAQPVEVRRRALEAIGVRNEEWVARLIDAAYNDDDPAMRASAVHAMGRSADPRWLSAVLDEMESDEAEMRFEAAAAAGSIGDEQAVPALARLTSDEDAEVQETAIQALGEIGGPLARASLHTVAAESDDERVLQAVSDALALADFADDPLGIRLNIERSVAEDLEDEDQDL
jgi:HEAT repeat protein